MSETKVVTKLEFLPNEILIECLQFLNVFEIFDSFDRLNYRFDKLIRNIPLHLNFQYVFKSQVDQFCTIILLNPEIKKQIYSLRLSNDFIHDQIEIFLSYFSLNEFLNLRSLSLNQVMDNDLEKLTSMLPLISSLYHFHLTTHKRKHAELLSVPSMSNLQILSLPRLHPVSIYANESLQITNLTLSECSLSDLCHFFKFIPMLKYLYVEFISLDRYDSKNNDVCFNNHCAVYLKQMVIGYFNYKFEDFEMLMKQTPNLKILKICNSGNIDTIDASRWEHLITTSLHYLGIFQFIFRHPYSKQAINIVDKFKQFQNSFWQEQHHWYTEYVIEGLSGFIYTIPYLSNKFMLDSCTKRYANKLINEFEVFKNVTDLALYDQPIMEKYQYYFPNIKSLKIKNSSQGASNHDACWLEKTLCRSTGENLCQSIKMNINLINLRHLTVSFFECNMQVLLLLSEIFKEAPQLSSISIDEDILPLLFSNDDLYKYLHKMIKKLELNKFRDSIFNNSHSMNQFCQLFSNIEHLKCKIDHFDVVLLLLNHLSKLSYMGITTHRWSSDFDKGCSRFKHEAQKLNLIYRITDYDTDYDDNWGYLYTTELNIWAGEKMNSLF